jgi:hypothetical protein
MSAVVQKIMLLGVTPWNFVMGTVTVQEYEASIFFSENAGSIIL